MQNASFSLMSDTSTGRASSSDVQKWIDYAEDQAIRREIRELREARQAKRVAEMNRPTLAEMLAGKRAKRSAFSRFLGR